MCVFLPKFPHNSILKALLLNKLLVELLYIVYLASLNRRVREVY